MKFVTMFTMLCSLNLMAAPVIVPAPVDHLFVPQGFDNNDNIEVIVSGKFPNPCFTRNKVEVKVQGETVNVTVTSLHKAGEQLRLCQPLKVPFTEVVTIGNLQGGNYKIVVNEKLNENLTVVESTSDSVDDHLYASVDYVELGFMGGLSGEAMLIGKSISSCLEFDHVEYISNGKDTFSILPIMKKVSDVCPEGSKRIEIPIKFDLESINYEKVLLFVRSVDGKSIQSVIERN